MNLKQLIVFGLENSQEPVIKNPVLRAALEEPRITAQEPRMQFDAGGMATLVQYVESLPKGTTVTTKMVEDFVSKNKINVHIGNFFSRKAPNIKNKKFDTSFQGSRLTDVEKANIEKFGKDEYKKLDNQSQHRVRKGDDVGSLAPEKLKKNIYKKEYDKAYKWYKSKGLKIDELAEESIRKNISKNKKFVVPTRKLKAEPGLTTLFKNYSEKQLIKDLKAGKGPYEISIEYFDKNKKEVLKMLEGKKAYTKPMGRLSTDLVFKIKQNQDATKAYNKIKKENSFKKTTSVNKYVKDLETLLPFAQEQGLVPKVNFKGIPIDTASKYFQYAYKVKADPIAKLFNYAEKVGIEHPAGVARAVIFNDAATLNEIVATMPDTNTLAGSTFDAQATGQAKFFERTGKSKYIDAMNKIIYKKHKEFGKPRSIVDIKKGRPVRRATDFSLTRPDLFKDAKSYINEYISRGGSKRESFKNLDKTEWGSDLKTAIKAYEKNDPVKGNKALKAAMKGAEIPKKPTIKQLRSLVKTKLGKRVTNAEAGFIATDMLKDFGKLGLKGGKFLKMLELQYEPLLESLFYQYYKKYKGYDHSLAREELFLPKMIAKAAPKLWETLGFKPFKTGFMEGADPLIEKELYEIRGKNEFIDVDNRPPMQDPEFGKVIGERSQVKKYIDAQKTYQQEVDKYNKLDLELKGMQNQWQPASPEKIAAKKKEVEDQKELLISLESTLKPGTPAYEAYIRAKEKQDHKFGMGKVESKAESAKRKEKRLHDEYLEYKGGKDRSFYLPKEKLKYPVEDPLFQKPFTFLETDDTFRDILEPGREVWEEFGLTDKQVGPVVREGIKEKWKTLYDRGGFDLMDRVGIAGGYSKMAGGGIAGIRRPGAVPPKSGPMPNASGLSTLYNRVKKI